MKYLAFIIIFFASVVTRGATLNGVLYDSSTKDIKPSSNVLVGTFSSVSTVILLGGTATLTNALTVPNGGSGVATLALNGVLYGNGAGAILALPVNSTATTKFLSQVSSGAPVWAVPAVPAFGSGTAGVNLRWASGGATAEDGYFIDGSGFTVPRTNNSATFGSSTNRLAGMNSVNINFSGQLTSTIASGTPPFVVASGTEVANLNAQYLGGVTRDYFNVGFILGDTSYWNGSGNPTRLLPNQNTNIAFYVQYGTGNAYPNISVAPFWMQVTAGNNISISRSSLTNFTINASTAAGVAVGTGTTGTYTKWSDGLGGLTDGALAASAVTNATLTGNILANGATLTNGLSVGTSSDFTVDTVNHRVGVGTNVPGGGLHLVGTDFNSSAFYVQRTGSQQASLRFNPFSLGRVGFAVGTNMSDQVVVLTLQGDGASVGIGTLSPLIAKLEVMATTNQVTLAYDATHFTTNYTDSSGNFTTASSGGTYNIKNNLVVSSNVNSALGFQIAGAAAKGSIPAGNGTNFLNTPVGTDGYTLFADSAQTNGIRWGAPTSGGTVTGTGTAGVLTRWAAGGVGIEDGYFQEGSGFHTPRTNLSATFGSSTNLLLSMNSSNGYFAGNLLIGTSTSNGGKLEVQSTTEQFRLNYDPTHNLKGTVDAAGNMLWVPSGGVVSVTGAGVFSSTMNATGYQLSSVTYMNSGGLSGRASGWPIKMSTTGYLGWSDNADGALGTIQTIIKQSSSGVVGFANSTATSGTGSILVSNVTANGTVSALSFTSSGSSFGLTADATVANTTTETTLLGTAGAGSKTLSANVLTVGRTLHGVLRGRYGTAAVPGTVRIKVKFGSTVILDTNVQTPPSAASGKLFDIDYDITCRTTGGSGTIWAQGKVLIGDATGLIPLVLPMVNTTTSTIDTTATQVVDVTATWATADASNTITASVGSLQ